MNDSKGWQQKGYLAILTEPDACDSPERIEETRLAFERILAPQREYQETSNSTIPSLDPNILISIRVEQPADVDPKTFRQRLTHLTSSIVALKRTQSTFEKVWVVVNDNVEAALEAGADGVHVKERNVHTIPTIRKSHFEKIQNDGGSSAGGPLLIGTSVHDVDSALDTWRKYQPNYFFVGTCFVTQTHPEKEQGDLEGPSLPGQVKSSIEEQFNALMGDQSCSLESQSLTMPKVFAIGGINVDNCRVPIQFGADGVAMIRAVMRAPAPREMVQLISEKMLLLS